MTNYIDTNINQYPSHQGDILLQHPDWDFANGLPDGIYEVEYVAPPSDDTRHYYQGQPEMVDGKWRMTWESRDYTPLEIAMNNKPSDYAPRFYDWDEQSMSWIKKENIK